MNGLKGVYQDHHHKVIRMDTLQVVLDHPNAKLPERKSDGAAGYDLFSCTELTIPAGRWTLVDTGIRVAVPFGTYGRVAPRSGLSCKGICVGAGVIDGDYTGVVKVLLFNHAMTAFPVMVGDRVAQLILEKVATPQIEQVQSLQATQRGDGGFGSTGQ